MKDKENLIDNEFKEINENSKTKYYIIPTILYLVVIGLVVLLVLGIRQNNKESIEPETNQEKQSIEEKTTENNSGFIKNIIDTKDQVKEEVNSINERNQEYRNVLDQAG